MFLHEAVRKMLDVGNITVKLCPQVFKAVNCLRDNRVQYNAEHRKYGNYGHYNRQSTAQLVHILFRLFESEKCFFIPIHYGVEQVGKNETVGKRRNSGEKAFYILPNGVKLENAHYDGGTDNNGNHRVKGN